MRVVTFTPYSPSPSPITLYSQDLTPNHSPIYSLSIMYLDIKVLAMYARVDLWFALSLSLTLALAP